MSNTNPLLHHNNRYLLITLGLVGAVSFFDFLASWHLISLIGIALSPNYDGAFPEWQVLIIFMAGYLSRPLGAYFIGRYGDRYGRKPALLLSFSLLIIFTLLIGLLPTHQMVGALAIFLLIIARIGQGMALGSQFPILWTYATEKLPLANIGLGAGLITGMAIAGGLAFFMTFAIIENTLTQLQLIEYGWRLPFLLSGVLGGVLFLMAKKLEETPVFLQHREKIATAPTIGFFKKARWQKSLSIIVLSWFIASIVLIMVFLLSTLLDFSFANYGNLLDIGTQVSLFFMGIGCVFFGFLTDRTNPAKVLAVGCILLMLGLFGLFYDLSNGGQMMLLSFALSGFFSGIVGAVPAILVRLMPMQYRLSGTSLLYNSVYALIAMGLPMLLGYATFYAKYSPVVYVSFLCVVTLFLSFYLYYYPQDDEELQRF